MWVLFPLAFAAWVLLGAATPAYARDGLRANDVYQSYLKRSDVLLSPRFYRPNWRKAFDDFEASRIVWTYTGPRYLSEGPASGVQSVQCTFPAWVPTTEQQSAVAQMACTDKSGQPRRKSFASGDQIHPDVNTSAWRRYMLGMVGELVAKGCRHFHQDDAQQNVLMIGRGGCNSPESLELKKVSQRLDSKHDTIRSDVQQSERQAVVYYYAWLHRETRRLVREREPNANVTFSANITTNQIKNAEWIAPSFDFLVAEAYGNRENLRQRLTDLATFSKRYRQVSAVTIPSNDVWLNQRGFASAYALGFSAIVPWDVYVGAQSPRFFGSPVDFTDIFGFVRRNAPLFDDYVPAETTTSDAAGVLVYDGVVEEVRQAGSGGISFTWTGSSRYPSVTRGMLVRVGEREWRAAADSANGELVLPRDAIVRRGDRILLGGSGEFQVVVNEHRANRSDRAVHLVNWGAPGRVNVRLNLRQFPVLPGVVVAGDRRQVLRWRRFTNYAETEMSHLEVWAILSRGLAGGRE